MPRHVRDMLMAPKAPLFALNVGALTFLSRRTPYAVVGSRAMNSVPFLNTPEALRQLADQAHTPCQCSLQHCAGWESVSEAVWPAQQMQLVATLRDPDVYEPTFEELHPNGTRYDSADAPVALKFFPYNRCDVYACSKCQQHALRYTEFGGYYVDPRARLLAAELITD